MKTLTFAALLFTTSLLATAPLMAETLAYPGPDNASFIVDHPSDWEVESNEEVGDYVTLNGPTGVVLQLRTIPGTETAISDAIDESIKYLKETFTEVKMEEPKEIKANAMDALLMQGTGVDGNKEHVSFALYYISLSDGNIAEIWFAVIKGDTKGQTAAVKILNSFRAPPLKPTRKGRPPRPRS